VNLNIRGTGSLSGSNPYIVIDGVRATEDEFSNLNPNDIKSISVLKDAAASAIYGSHAAFGAIVVTTKSGKENQDITLNYSSNIRFKKRIYVPESVNSVKWAQVANDASMNFSGGKIFSNDQIDRMRAFIEGERKYGTEPMPNNPSLWRGVETGTSNEWFSGYANTDWWDIMYKDIQTTQKHNISVQGGSDKITYFISGGYLNDPG